MAFRCDLCCGSDTAANSVCQGPLLLYAVQHMQCIRQHPNSSHIDSALCQTCSFHNWSIAQAKVMLQMCGVDLQVSSDMHAAGLS